MLAEAAGCPTCDVGTGGGAGCARWDPIRRIRMASEPDFLSLHGTAEEGDGDGLRGPWRTWTVALTEICIRNDRF